MLNDLDIKVIGIFGIVLILIIGYLVYVMYQDTVFLKKEIASIKTGNNSFEQEDNESWCSSSDQGDEEMNDSELDDEIEDTELDRHLASFMNQQIQREQLPVIEEVEEKEPEMFEAQEQEPEMCEVQEPVKKRSYKKKKVEFAEQQEIEE